MTQHSDSDKPRPMTPALWFLLFGILLVTFNLRGAITGVGPVLIDIQDRFGLSSALAGFLTTLPLFAFAFISPLASPLARRTGMERAILIAVMLLIAGLCLRLLTTALALYFGMAIIGIGVAIGNVVVPGLVRRDFPQRLTLVTALFTMAMVTSGGLGSGITVPLAQRFGWPGALFVWVLPAILGLLVWLPQVKAKTKPAAHHAPPGASVWRSPTAWHVSLFMGFQSTGFYVYIAWFPSIMAAKGVDAATSGWQLFVFQILILTASMLVPMAIHRMRDQTWIGLACGLCLSIGYVGILLAPDWVLLWLCIAGLGSGGSLVLALTMFGLRASSAQQTVALSGMAQSVGYFMAAVVPIILGVIHDWTHTWTLPLVFMVGNSLLQMVFGWLAGRPLKIGG